MGQEVWPVVTLEATKSGNVGRNVNNYAYGFYVKEEKFYNTDGFLFCMYCVRVHDKQENRPN